MGARLLRVTVTARVWEIVVVAVLGLATVCGLGVVQLRSSIEAERAERVRQVVDEAVSVVDGYAARAAAQPGAGPDAVRQAQAEAVAAVRSMRFGKDGYVWIMTEEPVMVMHPISPALDGQPLAARTDPTGKHLFADMAQLVRDHGSGFVRYEWPKPGRTAPQPKISYVRGVPRWGWVLGSGTYVDDVTATTVRDGALLGGVGLVVLLALVGLSGLVVTWLRRDVALVVDAVGAIAAGDLEERPLPTRQDELGAIGRSIAATRATLHRQRDDLLAAQAEREARLTDGFEHQRRAEQQVRDRAQSLVNETAHAVLAELGALTDHVDAVRRCANAIEEQVGTAGAVTRGVVGRAAAADADALALGGSLRQIGGMATLIGGVADQTKLLALNATIEAARAGAAGQGFSVVANEVKALATTTTESTARITDTITALEADAARVAAAITGVGQEITTLDAATGTLRDVATEQFGLVARLDTALAQTIDRVQDLAGLGDRLERRAAPRRPVPGTVRLTVSGRPDRPVEARLVDLSTSGLRCAGPATAGLAAGCLVDIRLSVGDDVVELRGAVARRVAGADPHEVGLRFTSTTRHAAETLRRLVV